MRTRTTQLMKILRSALCAAALLPATVGAAGLTDIASQPLAQPAANVPPNIMVLFDDSGSMQEQYTPDFIGRYNSSDHNRLCLDSRDSGGSIDNTLQDCEVGDPPIMSPQFNFQYYNPFITYLPAVNYDGSAKPSMTAAYTSNWTAVPTDGVSPSGLNRLRVETIGMFPASSSTTVTTSNLASNFPDREWCNSAFASTSYPNSNCRLNTSYGYPDATYGYGKTSGGSIRYTYGAPYYYLLKTTEYCSDLTLSKCIGSPSSPVTSPTTVGGVNYNVPAPVRYCNSTALDDCEQNYTGSYTRPKFTGVWNNNPVTQATAYATITVGSQSNTSGAIQNVTVNGTNLFGPAYPSGVVSLAPGPINTTTVASNIRLAINNGTATNGGYSATSSGNTVTIYAGTSATCNPTTDCTQANGNTVAVVSTAGTPLTSATGTLDISRMQRRNGYINSIKVNGTEILGATVRPDTTDETVMATAVKNQINSYTGTSGYSATSSGSTVTITAPPNTGSTLNGASISESDWRVSVSTSNMSGGKTPGVIDTSSTDFGGGQNAATSGRSQLGTFTRTSIVPGKNYPLYAGRTDCGKVTAGVCSYSEEMTNFANWYAYYRTRNTMTKTTIGRAFVSITSAFRVGMITLNPGSPVSSSEYLAADDFTSGAGNQKDDWYTHIYAVDANSGTPTREALSRVGQYFAGLGSTGTPRLARGMGGSPIQYACQANYTVLVTDGYWNGSAGETLSGGSIGNQDDTDSGYHTRAIGAYDGGLSGASNTLADTAMYYYQTDLRTDLGDQVPTTANDPNPAQHMDLFAVGLGLAGQLTYDPNYLNENATTGGDFWAIKQGSNWPLPVSGGETALDDLWHAAVNGHGQYFTARDPNTLSNALATALNSVAARVGAGAAAATSNLQPVAGDNFAFTAQYQTVDWNGDLSARTIDLGTGNVSYATLWSASALLDQRTPYDRTIYTFDPTDTAPGGGQNGNLLKSFCWPGAYASGNYPACNDGAELSATEMSDFNPLSLTQAAVWGTDGSGRTVSATPQNLVDYLRGDSANETTGGIAVSDLYRSRSHLLGDIVDAQPAYVRAAPFGYDSGSYAGTDPNYATFQASTATRPGVVFAAANDGMLHAFNTEGPGGELYYQTAGIATQTTSDDTFTGTLVTDASSGQGSERWAFVPSMLLPELKNLASSPYSHQYFTDGSPQIGDVCFGHTLSTPCVSAAQWHTILVAGLNGGGRGYYALDVTDPSNPKGLWEFSADSGTTCLTNAQANSGTFFQDCNLGYSFGSPLIVKRPSDGRWVVMVTSGYNNVNPGNGQGYLYILDAQTGAILQRIGTGVGCDGVSTTAPCVSGTADPSGLNHINAWVDNSFYDNTALRVYGVDLKGNLWRFQLDSTQYGVNTAFKLETLKDPSGVVQPLTTKPELASVNGYALVYVGTGRMLGTSDLTTTQVESIYALRDDLSSTPLPDVRTSGAFVQQTLSTIAGANPPQRTTTNNTVTLSTSKGWWVDLPDSGERVNVDPQLQLGTLIVATNVPTSDACVAGGYAWVNYLNYATGAYVPGATSNMASMKISSSLVVGINVVQLPGGSVKSIVTTADNQQLTQSTPVTPSNVQGRRVSWRELISQ